MRPRTGSPSFDTSRQMWIARIYDDGRRRRVPLPGIPACVLGSTCVSSCGCSSCEAVRLAIERLLFDELAPLGRRASGVLSSIGNRASGDALSYWTAQILSGAFGNVWAYPKPIEPHPRSGGVYFASAGALVKIGWSNDIGRRLNEGAPFCPTKIHLLAVAPGGSREERGYHLRFADARVSKEWFVGSDAMVAEMRRLRSAGAEAQNGASYASEPTTSKADPEAAP